MAKIAEKTILGVLLTAITPIVSGQPSQSSIRIPIPTLTVSLDPTGVQDAYSLWISRQVNCQLVRTKGMDPVPEAAKEFHYITPTQIKMTLNPDFRFADGTPISAKDVVATFDFLRKSRDVFKNVFQWVKRISAPDKMTVIIELNRPVPQFFRVFGAPNYALFPAKFIAQAEHDHSVWRHPIGCGGYRVEGWGKNQDSIVLAPRKRGHPITFVFMGNRQFIPSQAESFDLLVPPYSTELKKDDAFQEESIFDPAQVYVGVNLKKKIWRNLDNRCKLLSGIDLAPILAAYNGRAVSADSFFPRGIVGYQAKTLSALNTPPSSGRFNSLSVSFLNISVPSELRPFYLKSFAHIARRVKSETVDDVKHFARTFLRSNSDVFILALKSNYLDGYEFILPFAEHSANYTGINDPVLARQIRESQNISDPAMRSAAYQVIESKILGQCLARPLVTMPYRKVLVKRGLKTPGWGEGPFNEYYLGNVQ